MSNIPQVPQQMEVVVPIQSEKGKTRAAKRSKVRCIEDGTWFDASRSDAKYCSSTCRSKASRRKAAQKREAETGKTPPRSKKQRVKCQNCGKTFWTLRSDISRFDSDKCRYDWHNEQAKAERQFIIVTRTLSATTERSAVSKGT